MKLLVFWSVGTKFDRDGFELMDDVVVFNTLYHKRDELGTKIYDLDARLYNDTMWQYGIGSLSDLEDDYNNEDLDGGYWCKVLFIDEKDVKQIIGE